MSWRRQREHQRRKPIIQVQIQDVSWENFQGQLRDVRYYTKELSMEEVEGLYNGGVLGTEKLYAPLRMRTINLNCMIHHTMRTT